MSRKLLLGVVAAASIGFSGVASADTLNLASAPFGSDIYTATSISFSGLGSVGPGNTGFFSDLVPCASCVAAIATFNSGSGPITLFTITDGAVHETINLTSYTFTLNPDMSLSVNGSGTAIDGANSTPISVSLTGQDPPGTETSWSATIHATPLPPTWTMLLAGLLGFGMFAFRGSQKRSQVSLLAG